MNQTKPVSRPIDKKRWIWIISILVVILLAGTLFLVIHQAEEKGKQALVELLNRELSDDSEFVVDHFKIHFFPFGFTAEEIKLTHPEDFNEREPQKRMDFIHSLSIDRISVNRFRLWNYIWNRTISIHELMVQRPDIKLISGMAETSSGDDSPASFPAVFISNIQILEGSFAYMNSVEHEKASWQLNDVTISVSELDLSGLADRPYPGFDHIELKVQKLDYRTANDHYEMYMDSLHLNSYNNEFSLKNVNFNPLLTASEMADVSGHQTDQFNISLSHFLLSGFDLESWLMDGKLVASKVELAEPEIRIERDRSYPRRERTEDRILPHLQWKQMNIPVYIDTVHAVNGFLRYHEFYSEDNREGYVLFSQINLKAYPFQNITAEDSLFIRTHALFMGTTNFDLEIDFSLQDDAAHVLSGTLGRMDLPTINEPLGDLVMLRLQQGEMEQLNFWFYADNHASAGNLIMIYNNLEVSFLSDQDTRIRRRDRFRSFIANTFAVRSNNPANNPRSGEIEYERDPDRSMFSYWLRSLATGLEDTVKRL